MRNSKLCILVCCAGLMGATFLPTPTAAQDNSAAAAKSNADEQTKALEALRAAEAGPVVPDVVATNAAATPAAPAPTAEPAASPAPAPTAPSESPGIVAPTPAVTAAPSSGDDQNKALDALRHEEAKPASTINHQGPLTTKEREALLVEAQRQRKLAEERALTDRVAMEEAAKRQRAEDDAKVKEAMDKARNDIASQEAAAKEQQMADDARIKQAIESERAAAEQVRLARAEEAAAAERARIAKARAEAAERARIAQAQADAERLKKQMGASAVAADATPVPSTVKEQKLAELLRRYQADQITPFEYHQQRAKIIAEP
jgi:hypothetical protein